MSTPEVAAFDDARLAALFTTIDRGDAGAFADFLTESAIFRFGSAQPVVGRGAVRAAVDGFFASIAACSHRLERTWRDGSTLVCEGQVTYRRHDGTTLTLPFVNVFALQGASICDYRIYIDIAPLYAAGATA